MQVDTVDVSPESANHMIVSLNGVIQKPTDAYTVSGSTITFASALETGDVIDFIQILGNVLDLGVPSDATVSTAKIVDANVTTAKIADANVTTAKIADDAITSAKLGTGDMTFPNGNLVFGTAAKGIYLGVTSATAANLLDDYEEGTWTPTYVPDSGAFTSVTYASTSGYYVKIGRIVNFSFYIQTNGITVGTASGAVYIQGLPFAPSSPATSKGGGAVTNRAYFAGDAPSYATASGANGLVLFYNTGSTANDIQLNVTDLGTGGTDNVFQMFGSYYVE
jgi:hypothetical protein